MSISPKGINRLSGEQALSPRDLVMFENEQTILLGAIGELKKDKFRVFNERGREVELAAVRLHKLPGSIPSEAATREQQQTHLQKIRAEAETEREKIDIQELWLIANESPREWGQRELAELLYNTPSLTQYTALRLRLLTDRIFFKRDKYGFIPRSTEVIEELKRAEDVRLEKKNLEKETVEFMQRRLNGDAVEVPMRLRESMAILEDCAAASERIDHGKQKEVKELLQLFTDQTQIELHGALEERAFTLLCRIGHFNRNTNLSMYRHNPRRTFSDAAMAEAKNFAPPAVVSQLPPVYQKHIRDLTSVAAITIDDQSTKDMDDALSIEQTQDGYRLGIHISNVSLGVKPGSALETEAVLRATSIYVPDFTINMLPPELSEDKLSLCAGEVRPALSCLFELDHRLSIVSGELALTLIKVAKRYSYDEVDELLAREDHDLSLLYNIASQKEQERLEAGAVKVQKGDAAVVIAADQTLGIVEIDEQSPARSLVGEMMVLANGFMATFAAERNIPLIFRGQPLPDKGKQIDPRIPEGPARDYALRSLLKKSTTSFSPQHHASLGLDAYAQITSPIRRFADIVNQRQLISALIPESHQYSITELEQFTAEIEKPLSKATQVSRESKRFWLLRYLEEYSSSNTHIQGTVIRTDLKYPIVELDETYLTVPIRTNTSLRPGDRIVARLISVKAHDDQARLEIVS